MHSNIHRLFIEKQPWKRFCFVGLYITPPYKFDPLWVELEDIHKVFSYLFWLEKLILLVTKKETSRCFTYKLNKNESEENPLIVVGC